MDKNKSTKLAGLITRLTVAANKAVKRNDNCSKQLKRNDRTDYKLPMSIGRHDHRFQQFRLAD